MVVYNSSILKHEAEHFDELVKQFPDLSVQFDETSSYYYSDLIFPVANKLSFNHDNLMYNNSYGTHTVDPMLVVKNCNICNDIYNATEFVINSHIPAIRICVLEGIGNSLHLLNPHPTPPAPELMLSSYNYEDAFLQLQLPTELIKEVDLYVIKLIRENSIKHLRVNKRIRDLLTFI